jgi:hypothetical protein
MKLNTEAEKNILYAFEQYKGVSKYIEEHEPFTHALMAPVITHLRSMFLMKNITEEDLISLKERLHVVDSVVSNMSSHGTSRQDSDIMNSFEIYWDYLYGIFDHLCFIYDTYIDTYTVEEKDSDEG